VALAHGHSFAYVFLFLKKTLLHWANKYCIWSEIDLKLIFIISQWRSQNFWQGVPNVISFKRIKAD